MIPGQLIAPRQLTDLGVHFASVHGLAPVTVHITVFRCPGVTSRGGLAGSPPCRGNFSPCEQNAKVTPGQEQSCVCSLLFRINFPIKSSRQHQK